MRIELDFPKLFLGGLVACVGLSLAAYNLLSVHYDYIAESISIGAFLRMQDGLPCMSSLADRPLYLNQYSPLYYLIHLPFIRLLPHTLKAAVLLGRATALFAGLGALRAAYLVGREIYGSAFRAVPFGICAAFMLIAYPELWNAIRPDLFSVCFELWGILWFVKGLGSSNSWHRIASAVACGMSVAFKLNQIGAIAVVATVLFLVQGFRGATSFVCIAVSAAATGLFIGYLWAGDVMLSNMGVAIQNVPVSAFELSLNITRIAQEMFVGFAPLFGAAALGLALSKDLGRAQLLTLFLGVAFFLLFASLGQLKAGASINYYHDFCVFLLIPAAWGVSRALAHLALAPFQRRIGWICASLVALMSVAAMARRTLYNAVFMRSHNYPYAEAAAFLRQRHPGAAVYMDEGSAAIHLREFTWIGPGHETIFPVTPKLRPTIQHLRAELTSSARVAAAVSTGATCQYWKPSGAFASELATMTELEAQFGRICIFGAPRSTSRPSG
jgi:hypothetical protein